MIRGFFFLFFSPLSVVFGLNSASCSGFVLCAGGLHSKAGLLAAGWAEIPWSLIRANVKTFPRARFVSLKTIPLAGSQ